MYIEERAPPCLNMNKADLGRVLFTRPFQGISHLCGWAWPHCSPKVRISLGHIWLTTCISCPNGRCSNLVATSAEISVITTQRKNDQPNGNHAGVVKTTVNFPFIKNRVDSPQIWVCTGSPAFDKRPERVSRIPPVHIAKSLELFVSLLSVLSHQTWNSGKEWRQSCWRACFCRHKKTTEAVSEC